jgi:hypothetical protein
MKRNDSMNVSEYHEHRAISSGFIRAYQTQGSWYARSAYVTRDLPEDETKDWQRLGTALHLAMEDQEKYQKAFIIIPTTVPDDFQPDAMKDAELKLRGVKSHEDLDGTGSPLNRQYKRHAAYLGHQALNAAKLSKSFLTEDEADVVSQQVAAIWDNRATHQFIGEQTFQNKEVPVFDTCDETGLELKALADILLPTAIIDFKSTRHRTTQEFIRDAWKKGYPNQISHYMRVCHRERGIIIAVTKTPPFESMVYEYAPDVIAKADESNRFVLRQIKNSFDNSSWHSLGFGQVVFVNEDV